MFDFFTHLHSKSHRKTLDPYDRPWASSPTKISKGVSSEEKLTKPAKGSEFLVPVRGFFCLLCKEFYGDAICAEEHVVTHLHNEKYKKQMFENPLYEQRRNLDRQAGLALEMSGKKRKHEDEEKGAKDKDEKNKHKKEKKDKKKEEEVEEAVQKEKFKVKKEEEEKPKPGRKEGDFKKSLEEDKTSFAKKDEEEKYKYSKKDEKYRSSRDDEDRGGRYRNSRDEEYRHRYQRDDDDRYDDRPKYGPRNDEDKYKYDKYSDARLKYDRERDEDKAEREGFKKPEPDRPMTKPNPSMSEPPTKPHELPKIFCGPSPAMRAKLRKQSLEGGRSAPAATTTPFGKFTWKKKENLLAKEAQKVAAEFIRDDETPSKDVPVSVEDSFAKSVAVAKEIAQKLGGEHSVPPPWVANRGRIRPNLPPPAAHLRRTTAAGKPAPLNTFINLRPQGPGIFEPVSGSPTSQFQKHGPFGVTGPFDVASSSVVTKPEVFGPKLPPSMSKPAPSECSPAPPGSEPSLTQPKTALSEAKPGPPGPKPGLIGPKPAPFEAKPGPPGPKPGLIGPKPAPFEAKPGPPGPKPGLIGPKPAPFEAKPGPPGLKPVPVEPKMGPPGPKPGPIGPKPPPFEAKPGLIGPKPAPFEAKPGPPGLKPGPAQPKVSLSEPKPVPEPTRFQVNCAPPVCQPSTVEQKLVPSEFKPTPPPSSKVPPPQQTMIKIVSDVAAPGVPEEEQTQTVFVKPPPRVNVGDGAPRSERLTGHLAAAKAQQLFGIFYSSGTQSGPSPFSKPEPYTKPCKSDTTKSPLPAPEPAQLQDKPCPPAKVQTAPQPNPKSPLPTRKEPDIQITSVWSLQSTSDPKGPTPAPSEVQNQSSPPKPEAQISPRTKSTEPEPTPEPQPKQDPKIQIELQSEPQADQEAKSLTETTPEPQSKPRPGPKTRGKTTSAKKTPPASGSVRQTRSQTRYQTRQQQQQDQPEPEHELASEDQKGFDTSEPDSRLQLGTDTTSEEDSAMMEITPENLGLPSDMTSLDFDYDFNFE